MPLLNLSVSQLLWVFVATNISTKLRPSRIFLRWIASGGLTCYRVPTNEELRELQCSERGAPGGVDYIKRKKKKNNKSHQHDATSSSSSNGQNTQLKPNEFRIRASDLTELRLNEAHLNSKILLAAPYGEDIEWVVDFALMSLISFLLTQLLFHFSPRSHEYNFSLVWVFLVILQCLLMLARLTSIYFKNEVSIGERSICIVSGCLFLLLAILVLIADERHLELRVTESLKSIGQAAAPKIILPSKDALLDPNEFDTPPTPPTSPLRPTSLIVLKLLIAVLCSLVGAIFTFPGFRFGQLHESLLANFSTSTFQRIVSITNYLAPVVVICLWIPTISRDVIKRQEYFEVDDDKFDMWRAIFVVLVNVFRFALVRRYVQIFLASSANRIDRVRFRGGMTTNRELQILVASINNYANVVCVQYILPTLMCLFTSIMFATLTYYTTEGGSGPSLETESEENSAAKQLESLRYLLGDDQRTLIEVAEEYLFEFRRFFSSEFLKDMLGFASWWFHFAWFCTTTAGVVYHKYFIH